MAASDHLNGQQFFHGSLHNFEPGDMIEPGHVAGNDHPPGFEPTPSKHVYATPSREVAQSYAKRYQGMDLVHGSVYHVEPTGPVEPDDMEDNSIRSTSPMRVVRKL